MTLRLWSNDLVDGARLPDAQVFDGMGYTGGNLSPHLAWAGEPEGTKSFVVTCYDPDAPTGSGWWHWIVSDLPAAVHELPAGAGSGAAPLPVPAVQSRTDFGFSHFGGAAPPRGEVHRYVFTVHAVDVESLGADTEASGALVGFLTNAHRLARASLTTTWGG
ncbi:MAG: kinase inhibitor [Phyllobacteriaceae bacterium]|nr:kinase inhibitor [Phyllobacteriaceae bacterium]